MAYRCEICNKGVQVGNNISHAHNKTKKRWKPNLHKVHVIMAGTRKRIRVCTTCIRSGKIQKAA